MVIGNHGNRDDRRGATVFERKSIESIVFDCDKRQTGNQGEGQAIRHIPRLPRPVFRGRGRETIRGFRVIKGKKNY